MSFISHREPPRAKLTKRSHIFVLREVHLFHYRKNRIVEAVGALRDWTSPFIATQIVDHDFSSESNVFFKYEQH